ncbi:T-cell immunomodulatory protein-like [Dendronephthya gigantea]|uniref:T-cell immunomodulatory protein-like n=1 Tax=Dendronephthya gigantea TaxID=151771 RepID=UPI001069EF49|nr:T-cell immunomodulatory protein-like [Dendronephthya gigantea]
MEVQRRRLEILYQILIYFSFLGSAFSSLKDVTSSIGLGGDNLGSLAAFGDFNADKEADLFYINNSKDKSKAEVYLYESKNDEFQKTSQATITLEQVFITNVIPGDFNSDGHLDALVSYYNTTLSSYSNETFVKVYLGRDNQFDLKNVIDLGDALKDQPAIVDFNGDLQPDLLAEKISDGERYWWKYNSEKNLFSSESFNSTVKRLPLTRPHSCAFLDVNGDYAADMVLTTKDPSSQLVKYEVWLNKDGILTTEDKEVYSQPKKVLQVVGQSTFADIDSDGIADHILPVCSDNKCKKSEVYVYSRAKNKWSLILQNLIIDGEWRFVKDEPGDSIPLMTIRIGDYNMDGFPDAAMVVEVKIEQKGDIYERKVILLENVECSGGDTCYNGRTFSFDRSLYSIDNPVIVGFLDLYDNGVLDLMVVSFDATTNTYKTHAIQNNVYSDTCFLKVIVLGGSCYSDCPSGVTPYGVNQAGPFVKYVTTGLHGDTKEASATQLSQAAYFALQPPYTVFGLGRTPNFVEELTVGLPRSSSSPERKHTWTSIIPNSQVIIIPYPPDDPGAWKSVLLVTPSKLVLLTGAALLATCVFIGALVGILHWKEKKEDRREKQEAAHKFHFDAM